MTRSTSASATSTRSPRRTCTSLEGGERVLDAFDTVATPGHASHHISYLDGDGYAYVGDVAGVRVVEDGPVLLPTPPPDIDLDAWARSVEAVAAWRPATLALPHFGAVTDPEPHLDAVREELRRTSEAILGGISSDEYVKTTRARFGDIDPDLERRYELVVPFEQNYIGLTRWAETR